jgi:cytochrome c-type biogenesis protein CcmH/NrfF
MRSFLILLIVSCAWAQEDDDDEPPPPMPQPNMAPSEVFPGDTLRCLVCQAIVDEFSHSIAAVDHKKKIEATAGRMDSKGNINSKIVSSNITA